MELLGTTFQTTQDGDFHQKAVQLANSFINFRLHFDLALGKFTTGNLAINFAFGMAQNADDTKCELISDSTGQERFLVMSQGDVR